MASPTSLKGFVGSKADETSPDDEKYLIEQTLSEVDNYIEATQEMRDHWARIYDSLEGKLRRTKAYPWSSAYHMRMLRTACWTVLPYMSGREITFQFEPVGDEDSEEARIWSPVIGQQFNHEINGYMKGLEWLLQAVQFGTAFMTTSWKTIKHPVTGQIIYDNPYCELNAIENVYVHPMYGDIQTLGLFGLPVIRSKVVSEDELLGQTRYDQAKIKKLVEYRGEEENKGTNRDSMGMVDKYDFQNVKNLFDNKKHYRIFERETLVNIITIAASKDGAVVLEKRKNEDGFMHTIAMKYELSSRPNRMYGVGIGDNGEEIEELFNDLTNQFMDSQRNDDNTMIIAEEHALRNPRDVVMRPSGVIWVKDGRMDGIRELNRKGIDPRRDGMLDRTKEKFDMATGTSPIMSGDTSGSDSATETDIQDRNARSRSDLSRQIAYKSMEDWGGLIWELDKKNIDRVRAIEVWDEETEEYQKIQFIAGRRNTIVDDGLVIDIGDGRVVDANGQILDSGAFRRKNPGIVFGVRGNYNLRIDIETTQGLNKNIVVKQLQDMLDESAQDPTTTLLRDKVREKILELRGITNKEQFFGRQNSQLSDQVVGQLGDLEGGEAFGTMAGGRTPDTEALSTARGQQQETQTL